MNQNPLHSAIENPIDWNEIGEWDGPANELDYAMVWNDENQGEYLVMILDLLCLPSVHDLNFFQSQVMVKEQMENKMMLQKMASM